MTSTIESTYTNMDDNDYVEALVRYIAPILRARLPHDVDEQPMLTMLRQAVWTVACLPQHAGTREDIESVAHPVDDCDADEQHDARVRAFRMLRGVLNELNVLVALYMYYTSDNTYLHVATTSRFLAQLVACPCDTHG